MNIKQDSISLEFEGEGPFLLPIARAKGRIEYWLIDKSVGIRVVDLRRDVNAVVLASLEDQIDGIVTSTQAALKIIYAWGRIRKIELLPPVEDGTSGRLSIRHDTNIGGIGEGFYSILDSPVAEGNKIGIFLQTG